MKLSIITVVLNRREYIRKAIENVLEQGYPDFEHIVIDGGSTDGTIDVLKEYPHLKWISEKDGGSVFALNKGLSRMTGDVFCWLNSDESYLPGVLKRVAALFEANPEWQVICGASNFVDESGHILGYHRSRTFNLHRQIVGFNSIGPPSAAFVRRGALQDIGFKVDETLGHSYDHELWIRLGLRYNIQNISECLSNFGIHGGSGICSAPEHACREADLVRKRYSSHLNSFDRWVLLPYMRLRRYVYIHTKQKWMIFRTRGTVR